MDRPRNRQPRQPQSQHHPQGGQTHPRHHKNNPRTHTSNKPPSGSVPTISQVLPGASVSIILKADQPTGREVQGTVQDVLTRGNHPRGIKVRLKDGRVGRVQKMGNSTVAMGGVDVAGGGGERWPNSVPTSPMNGGEGRGWGQEASGNGMPLARSLADFLPSEPDRPLPSPSKRGVAEQVTFASANIKCPFCSAFEGDEVAVSHHVQTAHLD